MNGSKNEGFIRITNLDDKIEGRTLYPAAPAFYYEYWFNQTDQAPVTKTAESGKFRLQAAADWNVTVKAYTDEGLTKPAATGTQAFAVTAGATTAVTVDLLPIRSEGEGLFVYNTSLAAGITLESQSVTLTSLTDTNIELPGGDALAGNVSPNASHVYTLSVSGITASATLTVAVTRDNHIITPAAKTVAVLGPPGEAELNVVLWANKDDNTLTDRNESGSYSISRPYEEDFTIALTSGLTMVRWEVGGQTAVSGTTNPAIINALQLVAGEYEVTVIAKDDDGVAYSTTIPLTVSASLVKAAAISGATVTGTRPLTVNPDPLVSAQRDGQFILGRTITIPSFKIAKYETTYEQWYTVRVWAEAHGYTITSDNGNPGYSSYQGAPRPQDAGIPVGYVSFMDVIVWCNALSEMEGKDPVYTVGGSVVKNYAEAGNPDLDLSKNGYRLPLDIEWEYAARGGDPSNTVNWNYEYPGSNNADEVAWHKGNTPGSPKVPQAVGQKTPNLAGLYDMGGNSWEWIWDGFNTIDVDTPLTGPQAVSGGRSKRGGSAYEGDYTTSVLWRWSVNTSVNSFDLGFRIVSR